MSALANTIDNSKGTLDPAGSKSSFLSSPSHPPTFTHLELQQLLWDLRSISAPSRSRDDHISIEGAHSVDLPAILNMTHDPRVGSTDSAQGGDRNGKSTYRDVLLVRTAARLFKGRRELTFVPGRLPAKAGSQPGSSMTATFTVPFVKG